jgi:hypothetical protein
MGLLRARRDAPRYAASPGYMMESRTFTQELLDLSESRHEPQTFAACTLPTDTYAAWREQLEADRERETSVRWVVRPRTMTSSTARENAVGDRASLQSQDRCEWPSNRRFSRT